MSEGLHVEIGVLGPIEVIDNGESISLSPQLRRLLGILVVADGHVVSADRLATYIADGRTEGSTVRTAVSRLRKIIGDRIESASGGYRLAISNEIDLHRFQSLRDRAGAEVGAERVRTLTEAVGLWRGLAFGEHGDEEWALGAAQSAEQARAQCAEELGDALVAVGEVVKAIEVLEPIVAEDLHREHPVELLMRALHGDRRTAEALRVFERFRIGLRDDVGLSPSAELRAVEAELLNSLPEEESTAAELPVGTVTFLFTDIVGSTQRWQADEAGMAAELLAHDEVLRRSVEGNGGVVFKHTGDGICAVFSSAPAGVIAALDAQAALRLPVRMGLHTGEAELRDGDYFGPTLNRSARIMDAGHGGQILVSASTAALLTDVALADLGEHRLKGLESPEHVWQIGEADYPPLRSETATKGNLPTDPSPFIGRLEELDSLTTLAVDHRMVSLIGVGGVGKTRLAIEAARALAPAHPDGCWLVELAETASSDLVALTIASALGMGDAAADPLGAVTKLLSRKRALLVIDNCEHVLDGAADAVEQIIDQCPTVTVIATSREPLMVPGERLAPTPSLQSKDAEALFLDRARAEAPNLALDRTQTDAISEICRRLDGLPLAIELAAARLRSMTPVEIERRLDERFRLLVGGRRSRVERHRTMAATLDWSLDLCSDVERIVFARLSVFASAFGLADAVAVAGGDDIDEYEVEDAIAQLVDRSLVRRVVGTDGASQFRLLETMRAYGHQRLVDAGDADHRRQCHAEHIDATLCALSFETYGPDEELARSRVRAMAPEVLSAATWCLDKHDWTRAYRLASASVGADWGTSCECFIRLDDAAAQNEEVGTTLGRCRSAVVADCAAFGSVGRLPDVLLGDDEDVAELLADEHHLVEDHLGYPLFFPLTRTRQDFDALARFLDELDVREEQLCYLEWAALETAAQTDDHQRVLERSTHVAARIERLGSRTLRLRVDGTLALALEVSGDVEAAADRIESLVDELGTALHYTDVVHTVRRTRIFVRAGRPVSRADICRPWEWIDANPALESARVSVLLNTAVVADGHGQPALARRLILQVPPDIRNEVVPASMFDDVMSEQLRAVLTTDEVTTEPLDAVKDDVFRFAATL